MTLVAEPLENLDFASFEDMFRTWYGPVVRLCRRHLQAHEAEVVAQDAFVRAWLSWSRFSQERPFGPWVTTIARRLCINESKAAHRRDQLADVPSWSMRPTGDDLIDGAIHRHALEAALDRLPARHRRILCLRDVEGWSYEEIARRDGSTVEAVRGVLKRARAEFRRLYAEG